MPPIVTPVNQVPPAIIVPRWFSNWLDPRAALLELARKPHGGPFERTAAIPRCIEHRVEELDSQRAYALALGYEDLNDHDELRHDPLLAGKSNLAGRLLSDLHSWESEMEPNTVTP